MNYFSNLAKFFPIFLILMSFCKTNAQWKTLPRAPKLEIFRDIEIMDDTKIYAVGMNRYFWESYLGPHNNYFIKTYDYGITWSRIELPMELVDVRGISFIDSITGFAIGQYRLNSTQAVILKTTDAGNNWAVSYITPIADSIEFRDVKIINKDVVVALGLYYYNAPSYLVRSFDMGDNWDVSVFNPTGLDIITKVNDSQFFISGGGERDGKFGTLMSTNDFGYSFQVISTPVIPDNLLSYHQTFLIADKNKIIIGGLESTMDYFAPNLYVSDNIGNSWQKIDNYKNILTLGGFFCGASDRSNNRLYFGGHDLVGDTYPAAIFSCDTNFQNWENESIGEDEGFVYEICISDSIILAYSSTRIIKLDKIPVDVENENEQNVDYSLSQNYPNPFNPSTVISYSIPHNGAVKLKVYNILGKEISTLVDEVQNPGTYKVKFDGSNLSSSIYLYRLETEGYSKVRKMVLLR